MSVINFKLVQTQVQTLIAAHAFFAGQVVALNVGKALAEAEQGLREKGQAIVVYPIQAAANSRSGHGAVILSATIDVLFAANPAKVGSGTDLNIYDMVSNGVDAVISYDSGSQPHDRFVMENVDLATLDDGSWGYVVTFAKLCVFG